MRANSENSAVATGLEKVSFYSNPEERQSQRMFKLPHNCTHLTREQSSPQNSPSQDSTVPEPWTSRCSSCFQTRQRNQRSNCQHLLDHQKSKRVPENIYFCFIDYAKTFDCVDHNKLWKILKEMGKVDHPASWEVCMLVKKQVRTIGYGYGTTGWFQIGKGVRQGCIYCYPAYLTYMQSTPWEMPGWMKHKLESRLLGEISITSDMQMTPPLWQKVKN